MRRHELQVLSLSPKRRYVIAVSGVIAAALLRTWLEWLVKADLHGLFFIVPVIVAGWYGGLGPGLLATGLSLLLGDLLFIFPGGSIPQHEAIPDTKRLLVFAFTGALVSILCAKARRGVKDRLEYLEGRENF